MVFRGLEMRWVGWLDIFSAGIGFFYRAGDVDAEILFGLGAAMLQLNHSLPVIERRGSAAIAVTRNSDAGAWAFVLVGGALYG